MEYCSGNGLIDFMNTRLREQLTEPEILQIACDIGLGVANMHYLSPPLIHRDLKIENVLISGDGVYKLCDFGSACNILQPPRNQQEFQILDNDIQSHTTAQYRAPEMVDIARGFPIDEKSDIWAFGVFIYKLCYYTTPFEREGNMAILNARFSFPPKPTYSDRLKRFINVTLTEDPRLRPNIYQCLKELYKMRGLDAPINDIYTAPTSTVWKDASVPQPLTQTLPVDQESAEVPQALQPSSTNPYRNSHTPSSTSSSSLRKTPELEEPKLEDGDEDDEAEAKYPTIEELSKDLEQQSFNFMPPPANTNPYSSSTLFASSFSNLPPAPPTSIPPVPALPVLGTSPMPITGTSPSHAMPINIAPQPESAFSTYPSPALQPSVSPWGSYKQPTLNSGPSYNSQLSTSYVDVGAWQATARPIESRSHTPGAPQASYTNGTMPAYFQPSTSLSPSSSSDDDASAVVDGTRPVRSIGLNRSNSTASVLRPRSSLSRPRVEENYSPVLQAQNMEEIQRPRPVSMLPANTPEMLLNLGGDPMKLPPPASQPTYPRGPSTEGTLIDPIVTDDKDNLKAMLSGLDEKSKSVFTNGELSTTDYLIALNQDTTGKSRHHSRSPSTVPYLESGNKGGGGGDEDSYIKSRSASRQSKRTSISLKSKIGDAFKIFDSSGQRSVSGQVPRLGRTSVDYSSGSNTGNSGGDVSSSGGGGYLQNKRLSYSTDNLANYSMQSPQDTRDRSDSRTSNKDLGRGRGLSPEEVVRQASFMEPEDAVQFERPASTRHDKYQLTTAKSSISLGRHKSVSAASSGHGGQGGGGTRIASSTNPAFTIQNKIQALINQKSGPPPPMPVATGYGKYSDDVLAAQRATYEEQVPQKSGGGSGSYAKRNMGNGEPSDYGYSDDPKQPLSLSAKSPAKSKHSRQLSVISSESSSTDSSDLYNTNNISMNRNMNNKNINSSGMGISKSSLDASKAQSNFMNEMDAMASLTPATVSPAAQFRLGGGGLEAPLPPTTSMTTATSNPIAVPPMAMGQGAAAARPNLMDDRSPALNGGEDWKDVFNKKYPSLA